MNKLMNFNWKEIVVLIVVQVFVIRFVAIPVVKRAIIDTFNENGIMCGYDESKNSTEK